MTVYGKRADTRRENVALSDLGLQLLKFFEALTPANDPKSTLNMDLGGYK